MLDKASDDEKERLDRRIIPEHYDRIPPGSRYYEYRRQQHSAKAETKAATSNRSAGGRMHAE
jgi:hypothetical protein